MKLKIPLLSRQDSTDTWQLRSSPPGKNGALPTIAAIVVRGRNGANLLESHNAETSDGTFFGWMTAGAPEGLEQTFSIHNVGTAPLKLGRTALEGTGADEFEVTVFPAPTVSPGGCTTFTIRYRGWRVGCAVALVLIPSNDATERPYLFLIAGEAWPR